MASWMTSPIWRTWVWACSGSWWWTGKPGVLQSMGSRRVERDWPTELKWIKLMTLTIPQSLLLCNQILAKPLFLSTPSLWWKQEEKKGSYQTTESINLLLIIFCTFFYTYTKQPGITDVYFRSPEPTFYFHCLDSSFMTCSHSCTWTGALLLLYLRSYNANRISKA